MFISAVRTPRHCLSRMGAARASNASRIHNVAAQGFAEGTNELYDRARPSYPPEALDYVYNTMGGQQGATVIEPGAGTGIFSRLLLHPPTASYPSFNLKRLVAVEPSAGMRATFEKSLSRMSEQELGETDVRVVDGSFNDLRSAGVPEGAADAVIIAQAWHWCSDHELALREIATYLKKGAPLILVWNIESNKDDWHKRLRETYQPLDLGSPQYYRMQWRSMFDTEACKSLFSAAEERHFVWEMGMTEAQVMDRILSKSYMTEAHLNGDKRVQVKSQLCQAIRNGGKDWLDEDKGIFRYKYTTDLVVLRKL